MFTNENGAAANSKEAKTTAVGQGDGVSGVNGGVNASSGRHQSSETVLSDITGGTVNINVAGHTQLTGALIAALDAEGNDTGNLSLNTGSLNFTDLSNRSYSSNQSFGVSGSVGVSDAANPADPNQSNTDLALNSSNYSYQNESSQSLDKTLATVGQGNITVGGEAAEPEGLNRDVDAINKELYAVDRQQGNIELTVDHRLLSEEGRKQIAEDAKRTEILGDAIVDVAKESVSLTGSGDGEDSLRDHIGNKQDYFTATKNFTQNDGNAEHMATLANDNATPEQKQAAYTALVNEIATYMGVDPTEAKVLMENDSEFAGYHSRDTDTVYVNDQVHNNATEAVNTVGHETQHYLDNQQNPDAERTEQYISNRENYAHIMGDATADYLDFNFAQNGSALANGNSHSTGSSLADIERNQNLLLENRAQLAEENPDSLDSCGVICRARLQAANPAVTNPVLPAAPGMAQEDNLDPNTAAAIALERDLTKLGGFFGLGSGDKQAAAPTEAEIFGKTLTEPFEVFDMLKVGQAFQMSDGSVVVNRGVANMVVVKPDSPQLPGFEMISAEQLGQQGGFLQHGTDAVITSTSPGANPNDIPGNVNGYPVNEGVSSNTETTAHGGLSSNTGTPVHEGHWSENAYWSESGEGKYQPNQGAVGNMGEFLRQDGFGSDIKNGTRKTSKRYDEQSIYQAENKIGDYINRGDQIYLDGSHKNHLEVFDRYNKFKAVLNLDGSLNPKKTAEAEEQKRKLGK